MAKELSTDEARQGVTGHKVRYVLMISVVGVIVALLATYALTV